MTHFDTEKPLNSLDSESLTKLDSTSQVHSCKSAIAVESEPCLESHTRDDDKPTTVTGQRADRLSHTEKWQSWYKGGFSLGGIWPYLVLFFFAMLQVTMNLRHYPLVSWQFCRSAGSLLRPKSKWQPECPHLGLRIPCQGHSCYWLKQVPVVVRSKTVFPCWLSAEGDSASGAACGPQVVPPSPSQQWCTDSFDFSFSCSQRKRCLKDWGRPDEINSIP